MAYVYGASKKPAPVVAAAPESAAQAEEVPKPARRIPGRKRGLGKNNKHGYGCGTPNGWAAHKRAGEDPCAACWKARREYKNGIERAARARKAAA